MQFYQSLVQKGFHLLMHPFLIAFNGQRVVGIGIDNLLGNLLLAAHRIHRHDVTAQFQVGSEAC